MPTINRVCLIGATATIATAVARRLAPDGARFFLVGRNPQALADLAQDLAVRGAEASEMYVQDANDSAGHGACLAAACTFLDTIDLVLIAHGTLADQAACERSVELALKEIATNGTSVVSYASHAAAVLEEQGSGCLAVISSVAGDRGRQSNYVYGAAKALVSTFMAGLRHRLADSPVQVLTIKPGLIDTRMTQKMPKGPLWSSPERVAKDIVKAVERGRGVIYTPWFWRYVMWIIRSLPDRVFHKTGL